MIPSSHISRPEPARNLWLAAPCLLLLVSGTVSARAQSSEDCLACHGDASFSTERRGRTVSLFIDAKGLGRSAHEGLECISCHDGFQADALPHANPIVPVRCSGCHGNIVPSAGKFNHGTPVRGRKPAASCTDCHSTHEIRRVAERILPVRREFEEQSCARCHSTTAKIYSRSGHGLAVAAGTESAPTCSDCHAEHQTGVPDSGAVRGRGNGVELCMRCHLDDEEVRKRVGPSAGFIASYETSVHGQGAEQGHAPAATCVDCHGSHEMKKGSDPTSKVWKQTIGGIFVM